MTRVLSINKPEIEATQKKYLSLITGKEGELAPNFYSDLDYYTSRIPGMTAYYNLIQGLFPQYNKETVICDLQALKKSLQEKANFTKSDFSVFASKLEKILNGCTKIPAEAKIEATHLFSTIKSIDMVEPVFQYIVNKVNKNLQISKYEQVAKDVPRGWTLDGVPIFKAHSSEEDSKSKIKKIKSKLHAKKIKDKLIDYLTSNTRQGGVLDSLYFIQDIMSYITPDYINGDEFKCHNMINDIETISPNKVIVTLAKYYGLRPQDSRSDYPIWSAVGTVKLEIFIDELSGDIKSQIIEGHHDIYDPVLLDLANDLQTKNALSKIYKNERIERDERSAIERLLAPLKNVNGDIDYDALNNTEIKNLLLLLWNNQSDAEAVLTVLKNQQQNFNPAYFFTRSINEINRDLALIKSKYHYSQIVSTEVSSYQSYLQLIKTKDVKAIEKTLSEPENRHKILLCLHTVNDVKFIKTLLKRSAIKNKLDSSVLTHFATNDSSIADALLQPSFLERIKFKIRSVFNMTSINEEIPYKRFSSANLKRILNTFPKFWQTHFKRPSIWSPARLNYRNKLDSKELRELIAVTNARSDSFIIASDIIGNDANLKHAAFPHDDMPFDQKLFFWRENSHHTMENIFKNRVEWQKIHSADDDELKNFYEAKLKQTYDYKDLNLVTAVANIWSDVGSNNSPWGNIPFQKKHLAKEAAINVIAGKSLNVKRSNKKGTYPLPDTLLVAEVFFTNPLSEAYPASLLTQENLQDLQFSMLSNELIFNSLFYPAKLEYGHIDAIAKKVADKPALLKNIIDNESFYALLKAIPAVYDTLKKILNHRHIQDTLVKNDDPLLKKIPSERSDFAKAESLSLVRDLFENPDFAKHLRQLPELDAYFQQLYSTAIFKIKIQEENDLFLFKSIWNITKAELQKTTKPERTRELNERLMELLSLLPKKSMCEFLGKEHRFLLQHLTRDPHFYRLFLTPKFHDSYSFLSINANVLAKSEVNYLLFLNTNSEELATLLLNCPELGEVYLSQATLQELDSTQHKKFDEFLSHLNRAQLALLIAKYPRLPKIIVDAKLFSKYQKQINAALSLSVYFIKKNRIEEVKASHEDIRNTIDELNEPRLKNRSDVVFNNDLTDLLSGDSKVIADSLLGRLKAGNVNAKTLMLLQDFEVIDAFVSGSIADLMSYSTKKHPLTKIAKKFLLLQKQTNCTTETHMTIKQFTNTLLARAFFEDKLANKIAEDYKLSKLVVKNSDPELFAQFIINKNVKFDTQWGVGLTNLYKKHRQLFMKYYPTLKSNEHFFQWLISQDVRDDFLSAKNKELCIEYDEFSHLLEMTLEQEFKKNGSSEQLLDWLLQQYHTLKPGQPAPIISKVLNNNAQARKTFLRHTSPEKVIQLLLQEIKFDPQSNLVTHMLTEPYVTMLLGAGAVDLVSLITVLKTMPAYSTELNHILMNLMSLSCDRSEIHSKLANSKELLEICLTDGLSIDPELTKKMLLDQLSQPDINFHLMTILNNKHQDILNLFVSGKDDNQLIELFLGALKYLRTDKHKIYLGLAKFINDFIEDNLFARLTNKQLNPHLQKQLMITLLQIDDSEMNVIFKNKLDETAFSYDHLARMIKGIAANDIIDLFLAEGVARNSNEPSRKSKYFVDFYTDPAILHRLFLEADTSHLLALFRSDDSHYFAQQYISMAKEGVIQVQLRKHLYNEDGEVENQLFAYFVEHSETYVEDICAVIKKDEKAFDSFVSIINKQPKPLYKTDKTLGFYLEFMLENKTADQLLDVIKAVAKNVDLKSGKAEHTREPKLTHHPVINYLCANIISGSEGNNLLKQKIVHLLTTPKPQFGVIAKLFEYSTLDQVSELLLASTRIPQLEAVFIQYFEQFPNTLDELFIKANTVREEFMKYFILSPRRLDIYLQLIRNESKILGVINSELGDNELLCKMLLLSATSSQLAQLFNYEATNRKQPITEVMFGYYKSNPSYLKNMLAAFNEIDDNLLLSNRLKDLLENEIYNKNNTLVNICYANYTHSHPLRFKQNLDKPLTYNQKLVYLYLSRLKLYYDIENESNKINNHNHFWVFCQNVVRMVAGLNDQGVLCLKEDDGSLTQPIPSAYSVLYFEAISRFFYDSSLTAGKWLQDAIESKLQFSQSLVDTLYFDPEGKPHWTDPNNESVVPIYYLHTVLYAHCQLLLNNKGVLTPSLIQAFLNSVTVANDQVVFLLEKEQVPPHSYIAIITKCLEESIKAKGILTTEMLQMAVILKVPLEQSDHYEKQMLHSVFIDNKGIMRSIETGLEVVNSYKLVVLTLLSTKFDSIEQVPDAEIMTLIWSLSGKDNNWRFKVDEEQIVDRALKEIINSNQVVKGSASFIIKYHQHPIMSILLKSKAFQVAIQQIVQKNSDGKFVFLDPHPIHYKKEVPESVNAFLHTLSTIKEEEGSNYKVILEQLSNPEPKKTELADVRRQQILKRGITGGVTGWYPEEVKAFTLDLPTNDINIPKVELRPRTSVFSISSNTHINTFGEEDDFFVHSPSVVHSPSIKIKT